jgi:predicted amidohydrolase
MKILKLSLFILLAVYTGVCLGAIQNVKCAIIQFSDHSPDEVWQDAARLENYVRTAAGNGAKIIVGPENCLYRYSPWSQNSVTALDLANSFDSLVSRFSALAKELNVCIVFGTREPSGNSSEPTYQSAVFIDNNGNLLKTYRKRIPSSAENSFTLSGGNDWTPFDTPYGKVWMQVCKDMDGDGYVSNMPTNIDLFIGVNKDPNRGWVKVDAGCARARCYGIGVNYAGSSGGSIGGNSGFVDTSGNMISEAGAGNYGANEIIIYEFLPLPVTGPDTDPPTIETVKAAGDPAKVTVVFSEPVAQAGAETKANYSIDNSITVSSALLNADLKTVTLTTSTLSKGITYTLTVNNITDRAQSPNTIVSDSKKSFSYTDKLLVSLVQYLGSGNMPTVVEDGFVEGAIQVNDRSGSQWTNIPPSLLGLTYLLTARDDKSNSKAEDEVFYRVNVSAACTVFALFQTSLGAPSWIASEGWENTSLGVTGDGSAYSVYKKYYGSGDIDLKRQQGGGSQGTGFVFTLASGPSVEAKTYALKKTNSFLKVFPSPFHARTTFSILIPNRQLVCLKVFSPDGRLIENLIERQIVQGIRIIPWHCGGLNAGVYFVKLKTETRTLTKKVLLFK